jgi:glycosyltransferase involved in cell wall biosynthesis
MRILYHHRTRATDAQGVHIREIVSAFRQLGHEVDIAGPAGIEDSAQDVARDASEAGWKKLARRLPLAYESLLLAYNAVAAPWLVWRILARRIDFVYERYALFNFAGVLAAKLTGRPLILEVNAPLALEQALDKEILAGRFARWAERVICNAAARVIVVSGPLGRILRKHGVRASKLALLPNGVNLEHLRRSGGAVDLRAALGLDGKVVIGFVGWFRRWHGLEFLLKVFHEAGLAQHGAALLFIGDGPAAAELKDYARAHRLDGSVVFSGPVPHKRIPLFLDILDVAVQPAANAYCCPMKILEYMGLAKAIVAPRQENIEELVSDGRQALLFRPGDGAGLAQCLAALVGDAELRERLGRQALEAIHRRGLLWSRNAEAAVRMAVVREQELSPAPQRW